MSKKTNNEKILEVRFVEPVNSEYFKVIKFFDKIYKNKNRSDSIRLTLRDFKILYDFFNVRTFEGLIKKIGIKVKNNVE
ncbi:MAG TPA: hypothetical protein VMZ91_00580 [Candidatus Paceibacterota bacterium]|nr:hypothetical protein [Candidatus Paceibacterota bacterium]